MSSGNMLRFSHPAAVPLACLLKGPNAAPLSTVVAATLSARTLRKTVEHAGASLGRTVVVSLPEGPRTRLSVTSLPTSPDARFASLSRVLLVGQPGSMFRTLANRKWPSSLGPISLLLFLFGTLLALIAAVRGILVRKVKACKCCKGFGVVRCRLCNGRGTVDWRAKFSYSETCPLCAARRFVVCPDCGGHYHRRLFNHAKGSKGTLEAYFPMVTPNNNTVRARSNPLD
nr:hypothetical protein [Volvox africanus]